MKSIPPFRPMRFGSAAGATRSNVGRSHSSVRGGWSRYRLQMEISLSCVAAGGKARLLVPKRRNGIQPCGAPSGIKAEEEADADGEDRRHHERSRRDRDGPAQRVAERVRAGDA